MTPELQKAQQAIQRARESLRRGDRTSARQWAEQAAKLAPQLEDPWLVLAAVASPRASIDYIQRALKINPDSPRAQKGMQWALQRLQQEPQQEKNAPEQSPEPPRPASPLVAKPLTSAKPTQRVPVNKSLPAAKKLAQRKSFPILLLVLGCIVVIAAAWTASTTPVLASLMPGNSLEQPAPDVHPQVWAQVEIAKPVSRANLEPTPALVAASPTQASPTPEPTSTLEPESIPTSTVTPPLPTTTTEPSQTSAPPQATQVPATSTPSGSLDLSIVENTPTPASPPTSPAPTAISPPVGNGERWIEVNLTEQRVYAWEGSILQNSFIVSTGTWQTPTVTGTFKIWNKTRIQAMSGPGYYLPNVPWVMYFYEDYGFHGTYWHNNFGTPMSHGCVNLTIPDSEWLYNFASVGTTVRVHY